MPSRVSATLIKCADLLIDAGFDRGEVIDNGVVILGPARLLIRRQIEKGFVAPCVEAVEILIDDFRIELHRLHGDPHFFARCNRAVGNDGLFRWREAAVFGLGGRCPNSDGNRENR